MTKKQQSVDLLIKTCEGIRLKSYKDSIEIWTIAFGTTHYPDGKAVKEGDTCTEEQAYDWLNNHLNKHVYPAVDALQVKYHFNDAVYCSLCSFAYNLGAGALKGESIIAALEKADLNALATAFRKYVKADGKIIKGLVNRREIEIKNFMETK